MNSEITKALGSPSLQPLPKFLSRALYGLAILFVSGVIYGVDFFGQDYGGWLSIQSGDAPGQYHLNWIITGYIQEGPGMLEGNQLLVEWRTISGPLPDLHGIATYTVTVNGELYGTRQAEGFEQVETETVYPNQE